LLDRVDLHVWVPPVDLSKLTGNEAEEDSARVRARVEAARRTQSARESVVGARCNADLAAKELKTVARLPRGGRALLSEALRRRGLSARAFHRVLRVARTIADLEGAADIDLSQLAEAMRYRILSEERTEPVASDWTAAR
jgi:magnesium chelatase family protein